MAVALAAPPAIAAPRPDRARAGVDALARAAFKFKCASRPTALWQRMAPIVRNLTRNEWSDGPAESFPPERLERRRRSHRQPWLHTTRRMGRTKAVPLLSAQYCYWRGLFLKPGVCQLGRSAYSELMPSQAAVSKFKFRESRRAGSRGTEKNAIFD